MKVGHPCPTTATSHCSLRDDSGWLLVTAATAMELEPLRQSLNGGNYSGRGAEIDFLNCGVGPTATAASLAAWLACRPGRYAGVIMTGVAGAYMLESAGAAVQSARVLDICVAEREVLGDFGLACDHGADPFDNPQLAAEREFSLHHQLLQTACDTLRQRRIPFHRGTFVTVNAASTTRRRGMALAHRHLALCENMEGAAAALVCQRLGLPLLEIRCISNLVEDRDLSRWQLPEAVARNAEILSLLLPELLAAVAASS
ncbi:futalosine hydrolase [Desulfurivibrio alkaliphilus]|uniref:Futalosine hydrolase n=1 Tax=Desulfurivibrio alkaliphilus (strain DSM 19089 / UNIQEM U267 / AHT2) TaxID=589865 RepID=D6Z1H2_DESAT|nr:futalosine hydrolase [Desulfurivibrio alkaliphilus]ADH85427.1 futalosine nucleosidase [Desulfurivibrio alkaliphilus AHT 2]